MIYEVILKSGRVLKCHTRRKYYDIIKEFYANERCIAVQENEHPEKVTFIFKEDIDCLRFPRKEDDTLCKLEL